MERIWRPDARQDDSKRKYLNWPTADEAAWTTPEAWAALTDTDRTVRDGEQVVLFFDGSKSRDATALIGCCLDDGHVFTVGVWEPNPAHNANDVVPVAEVDAAVQQAFDRYEVVGFFADVQEWESFTKIDWPDRFGDELWVHAVPGGKDPQRIAWDMRSHVFEFTRAAELVEAEITEGVFTHDGDSRTARHVANARRKPNRYGVSIGKESPASPRKVDAAVCVIGARMVYRQALANRKEPGIVVGIR
jgi:phage terminase large subunit-like protein